MTRRQACVARSNSGTAVNDDRGQDGPDQGAATTKKEDDDQIDRVDEGQFRGTDDRGVRGIERAHGAGDAGPQGKCRRACT